MFGKKGHACSSGLRMKFAFSYYATFFGVLLACFAGARGTPHPIILVPGYGASPLEAKLDKFFFQGSFGCPKSTEDYTPLWTPCSLRDIYCLSDNMKLVYKRYSGTTRNVYGVKTRVPGFGNTDTIEYLDCYKIVRYMKGIVKHFVHLGYERGVNIRGAPYDFRKSPHELIDSFGADLKKLIEETYELNNQKSVILVCHSWGCLMSLVFLNKIDITDSWKEKYIRALVTLGAPWDGSVTTLHMILSIHDFGIPFLRPIATGFRNILRTFPSIYYLLPSSKFWSEDILVKTPAGEYNVHNYDELFREAEIYNSMTKNLEPATYWHFHPQVEVYCVHGSKVDTIESLVYDTWLDDPGKPEVKYGDGDGTVNLNSLRGCLRWKGKGSKPVHHIEIENVDHLDILSEPDVLRLIRKLALPDEIDNFV